MTQVQKQNHNAGKFSASITSEVSYNRTPETYKPEHMSITHLSTLGICPEAAVHDLQDVQLE